MAPARIVIICVSIALFSDLAATSAQAVAAVPTVKPTADTIAEVTREIDSGDAASVAVAEKQIRVWLDHRHIPFDLSRDWLPGLAKAGRQQEVADLALAGLLAGPKLVSVSYLAEWRVRAFLAIDKPQMALRAAKSYFNVCPMDKTEEAIELVALCLVKCHPDDQEIARRFRLEQSMASGTSNPPPPADAGSTLPSSDQSSPILKSVVIDAETYSDALKTAALRTKFFDRAFYGNLLLVADRGVNAEKVFRELYKLAATQEELDLAVEGIARSLRAEDGNLGRANAWLAALQQGSQTATTQQTP